MNDDFARFMEQWEMNMRDGLQRAGQAAFNALSSIDGTLAHSTMEEHIDPFHVSENLGPFLERVRVWLLPA